MTCIAAACFKFRLRPSPGCLSLAELAGNAIATTVFILGKIMVKEAASNLYSLPSKTIAIDKKLGRPSRGSIAFRDSSDVWFFQAYLRLQLIRREHHKNAQHQQCQQSSQTKRRKMKHY
jgi:hypothetical protein